MLLKATLPTSSETAVRMSSAEQDEGMQRPTLGEVYVPGLASAT